MAYRTKKPELLEAWGIPKYEEGHIRVKAVMAVSLLVERVPTSFTLTTERMPIATGLKKSTWVAVTTKGTR